jgi:protein phosphatase
MNNTMYIICGVSGSGKGYFIDNKLKQQVPDAVVLSSDKMRGILFGDENSQQNPGLVFGVLKREADKAMKEGKNCIIDATNLNPRDRRDWITIAKKYDAKVVAYVIERDKATILKQQERRKSEGGRYVPEEVIDRMFQKYKRPDSNEGFDEVILV